jgi:pimeloyl-ACP methyl ester carboxylesterase
VWDVSRAVDVLSEIAEISEIDATRIACLGHSGGGTVAYYAAAMDERIRAILCSCAICNYEHSIAAIDHCTCNYLPGVLDVVELSDLAGLVAPRPFVMVNVRDDRIFPIDAVRETAGEIACIYRWAGEASNFRFLVGEDGHRFYPEAAWDEFARLFPP